MATPCWFLVTCHSTMFRKDDMTKIHFVGVGGIGMSALASIYISRGDAVSGSDLGANNLTEELRKNGAVIYKGHNASNVSGDIDLVVKSTCIRDDNPEIKQARVLGLPVIFRADLLKKLMEETPISIGVTGTHGKTTTSALISCMMDAAGKNPTVLVGGEMARFKGNARPGSNDVIVAEVDESDGHFRKMRVTCAVVTNVERDHMEHHGSFENLVEAFSEFMGRVPADGRLIFCGEDVTLKALADKVKAKKVSYGFEKDFDVTCENAVWDKSIAFDLIARGKKMGRVKSPLVGRHNVLNLMGAMAACLESGADFARIAEAAADFGGVKRRFEKVGKSGGIEVIEDYAHHPTEISSVINAARGYGSGRVVVIFQPHRYSRTKDLLKEFSECFYEADVLVLTDIYSAHEDAIDKMSTVAIYELIDKKRFERVDLVAKKDIPEFVSGIAKKDDVILVLGAGDVREQAEPLVREIEKRRGTRDEG